MATTNKAQYLSDIIGLLQKRYKLGTPPPKLSVLEAIVYGICHEGSTRAQAERALETFKSGFFDWNEVRVSAVAELQSVIHKAGIPEAEERANKLRRFLRQLFEKQYGFNLDSLSKKPLKDSIKLLQEYELFASDFVLATIIRVALGGHAIGVDEPMRRALTRLGVAEPEIDDPSLRSALERGIPKTKGAEFVDLIEELAHDTCVAGEPDCPRCVLNKVCPSSRTRPGAKLIPTGNAAKPAPAAPAKLPAAKPPPAPAKAAPPARPTPAPVASATKSAPAPAPKPAPSKSAPAPAPAPKPAPVPVAKAAAKPSKDKPGRAKP